MATVPVTGLELDTETMQRVREIASAQHISPEAVIYRAIELYIEPEDERRRLDEHTRASWGEYQRTGLHLTGEEVEAWMDKIIAGEDAELPECHL